MAKVAVCAEEEEFEAAVKSEAGSVVYFTAVICLCLQPCDLLSCLACI